MRSCIIILAFLAAPLRPVSAGPDAAEEASEPETFRADRLWHLAELPAWWFAWLAAHEGMHALMSQYWDWEVAGFHPYPHFSSDPETGRRSFYWGATYLRCAQKTGLHWDGRGYVDGPYWPRCKDGAGLAAVAIAPYVLNASVFAVSDLILAYEASIDSLGGSLLYMGGMVGPWVNSLFGMNFLTGGPDLALFSERTGMPKWAAVAAADAVMLVGAWRLYVRGRDLLFDGRTRRKENGAAFLLAPMPVEGGGGLSLSFRW